MKKTIILSLLIIGSYVKMFAQVPEIITSDKAGWHKIGETTVDFKAETDEILVMGADHFELLKFKVKDAPINLISLEIYYENDNKQTVSIGKEIKKEGESRTIQLNDKEKNIKKVVFRYKTISNEYKDKAHIELWGLKTMEKKNTNGAR